MPHSKQLSQQLSGLPFVYPTRVMNITANSHMPRSVSNNLESVTSDNSGWLAALGSQLVFTQDEAGRYLSFYWHSTEVEDSQQEAHAHLELKSDEIVGDANDAFETFAPIEPERYLERVARILTSLVPERVECWFSYGEQLLNLDLVISPILPKVGEAACNVLVMGRVLQVCVGKPELIANLETPPSEFSALHRLERHKQLVNQITKNIWRTLDLEVIWQQTVDNLGQVLSLARCLICPYDPDSETVVVKAEYREPSAWSMLGSKLDLAAEPALAKALATKQVIVEEFSQHPILRQQKILVVPTCYQGQPNALICVSLQEKCFPLTAGDLDLAQEVADQIGTAIAHATLYHALEEARASAEEASRKKSEFLANMSHELRTPLNGMIGFIRLILDGMVDDPEEQKEFLQEAHKSSIHLLEIINDILDIARIEAGKMELELRSVQLHELFTDVEKFMRPQSERKNLSFCTQMPHTCDEILVYGDYQRLKQVMLNLVYNAIKFTDEGGITISADVVRKKMTFQDKEFPGMVKVRVQDTGIGVSLEEQEKLFQLFSQIDASRTRKYGGTGLGLTISQKLVEAMGGTVHFYSLGEGLGSTVTFTVPLYQQPVLVSSTSSDNEP